MLSAFSSEQPYDASSVSKTLVQSKKIPVPKFVTNCPAVSDLSNYVLHRSKQVFRSTHHFRLRTATLQTENVPCMELVLQSTLHSFKTGTFGTFGVSSVLWTSVPLFVHYFQPVEGNRQCYHRDTRFKPGGCYSFIF